MRGTTRFKELDALRGIAALWVVLFHYLLRYDQIYHGVEPPLFGGLPIPDGLYAVNLFFTISGFVIFMTLRHCTGAADFIVSRFSRLYPAYWAAIALTSAMLFVLPLPDQHFSLSRILVNLTMVQQYVFVDHVDGSYWSLTYELAYYAIMLVLYLTGLIRRIETVCWVWLAVTLTATLLADIGFPTPYRLQLLLITPSAQFFIAGIMFYLARHEGYTRNRVLLLAACLLAAYVTDPDEPAVVYAALSFIVFHLAITGRLTRLAASPVLQWLGAISYPLYLIHQIIGYRIIATLLENDVPRPLVIVIVLSVVLALATLLSRTIERPAMRLIRQTYRRFAAARLAVT